MAVYTQLSRQDIENFLSQYPLGKLVSAEGIAEGVENSNYLLTVGMEQRKYILTVFERRTEGRDLPFFMHLTEWLAERGIPCPKPVKGKDGGVLYTLKNKPAAIVSFVEGKNNPRITPAHLTVLGDLAARMHLAAEGFLETRRNALSIDGWQQLFIRFRHRADEITPGCEAELTKELDFLNTHWPTGLPRGIVHTDLFPDNVFFIEDIWGHPRLSGVIDFYFAANDFWLYDLMICVNAWCFDADAMFIPERAQAFFAAYERRRPLTDAERDAMPVLARAAALRIIMTRSHDWLHRDSAAMVTPKDPKEYIAKLRFHREVEDYHGYGI